MLNYHEMSIHWDLSVKEACEYNIGMRLKQILNVYIAHSPTVLIYAPKSIRIS
jgi:hypothetical protein